MAGQFNILGSHVYSSRAGFALEAPIGSQLRREVGKSARWPGGNSKRHWESVLSGEVDIGETRRAFTPTAPTLSAAFHEETRP